MKNWLADCRPFLAVPEAKPATKYEVWTVQVVAVLTLLGIFLYSFFLDRLPSFDEIGLSNAIYTYLHDGKMTYPAHGEFDSMTIHPPVHYLIIAFFMQMGLPLFHAAGMPLFLLGSLSVALILWSRFPSIIKIALLLALFCVPFVWFYIESVRPDQHLTFVWFAGLLALETARLASWHLPRLVLGSFLLTVASGLHYWGALSAFGILVYVGLMIAEIGLWKAKFRLLAMLTAVCVFAIPYLLLFLLPSMPVIASNASYVGGGRDSFKSLLHYLSFYRDYFNIKDADWTNRPFLAVLFYPVVQLNIPAPLLALPLLLFYPYTRFLALAALPLLLFVVFSPHKMGSYFLPECMLYVAGVIMTGLAWVRGGLQRWASTQWQKVGMVAITSLLTVLIFSAIPTTSGDRIRLSPQLVDLEVARASAKEIVGNNALVGVNNSAGGWYITGAIHFYPPWHDLVYPKYQSVNLPEFLSHFDALAITNIYWANHEKAVPIPLWYQNQTLNLKGFVFGNKFSDDPNFTNAGSSLNYLFLSTQRKHPLTGFAYREGQVYRFEEQPAGETTFFTAFCPSLDPIAHLPSSFRAAIATTPQPWTGDPHLVYALLSNKDFDANRVSVTTRCSLRDEVRGTLNPIDQSALLQKLKREDRTIQFHRTFEAALAGKRKDE